VLLVHVTFFLPLYSTVFLFVNDLIQPFLTFTPSTLLPTWPTPPLLDLFHWMKWTKRPIRFLHPNALFDFPCSITLLFSFSSFSRNLPSTHTLLVMLERVLFSHEATPFSSNFIEMNDSEKFNQFRNVIITRRYHPTHPHKK